MSAEPAFPSLGLVVESGIARITIDHPPMNLLDASLLEQLDGMSERLAGDPAVRVAIFASGDPDFFIAHADLRGMVGRGDPDAGRRTRLSRFAAMTERLRTMDAVSIALIEGRARGGGSEFALALDMRFAARETAVLAQPEVAFGIPPGGGATQRLPALTGRARALEIVLGAGDHDADDAERLGWINRALSAADLHPYVTRLAERIAAFPPPAIAAAKAAVDAAAPSLTDGLLEEHRLLRRALATPQATAAIERFLAAGGQTREGELDIERLLVPR